MLCTMAGLWHMGFCTKPISYRYVYNNNTHLTSTHIPYFCNKYPLSLFPKLNNTYPFRSHKRKGIVANLIVPVVFEPSKLQVSFVGLDEMTQEESSSHGKVRLPRIYTLTHCDLTGKLALTISSVVNQAQLQGLGTRWLRDEVIAEWKEDDSGICCLHVHCYICGGEWFLNATARLRSIIFRKDLPLVLDAFMHGDNRFFRRHPELQEAGVYVHFHSQDKEFNNVEFWGPFAQAGKI